jgi:hypothetical protein
VEWDYPYERDALTSIRSPADARFGQRIEPDRIFAKYFMNAKTNPQALGYVCILVALYLHLRPFSPFIVSSMDRQIASIDSGAWNVSLPRPEFSEVAL